MLFPHEVEEVKLLQATHVHPQLTNLVVGRVRDLCVVAIEPDLPALVSQGLKSHSFGNTTRNEKGKCNMHEVSNLLAIEHSRLQVEWHLQFRNAQQQ